MPSLALAPVAHAAEVAHETRIEKLNGPPRAKTLRHVDMSSPRDLAQALDEHGCSVRACASEMGVDERIPRDLVGGVRSITTQHIKRLPPRVALAFLDLLRARIAQRLEVVDVVGESGQ